MKDGYFVMSWPALAMVNLSITAVEDFTLPMAYRTQEGSTIESVDVNANGLLVLPKEMNFDEIIELSIYTILGQKIEDNLYQFSDHKINTKGLPKGEYEDCQFINCNLSSLDLSGYIFINCTFDGCDMSLIKLQNTILRDVQFKDCKMMTQLLNLVKDSRDTFMTVDLFDNNYSEQRPTPPYHIVASLLEAATIIVDSVNA